MSFTTSIACFYRAFENSKWGVMFQLSILSLIGRILSPQVVCIYRILGLAFILLSSIAGILFLRGTLVSAVTFVSLTHSASKRKKIHIQRRITSNVSITNMPPSSSLT